MNPTLLQFLTLLIPVIVGIAAVPIYDLIQEVITDLKKLPPSITQVLVLVFPLLANGIAQTTGVVLPTSLGGLNSAAVGTVISGLLAYLLKLAQNVTINNNAISATQASVQLTHQATLNAIAQAKIPDIVVNPGK